MRRLLVVAALSAVGVLPAGAAAAQSPTTLPCQPPITTCPTPTPSSSPSSARPSPTPSRTASPRPAPPPSTPEPTSSDPVLAPLPPPAPAPTTPPEPSVAPSTASPTPTPTPTPTPSPAADGYRLASGRVPVGGTFAAVAVLLVALPLLLTMVAARVRPAPAPAPTTGGLSMNGSTRWRLWGGVGALALAALVGIVGWYKISGEQLLNFQLPLLASAGITVVLLSVVGGSLLVADQLRGDDRRLDELEEAVRALAAALTPTIEAPPRRDTTTTEGLPLPAADELAQEDRPSPRRRRSRPTS
jgi:hypothetical protein